MTFGEGTDNFLDGLLFPIWEFLFGWTWEVIEQSGASPEAQGGMAVWAAAYSFVVVAVVVVAIMSFGFLFFVRYKKDKDGMLGYADSTEGQD